MRLRMGVGAVGVAGLRRGVYVVCVSHGDAVAAFMAHTGFTASKDNVYEVSPAPFATRACTPALLVPQPRLGVSVSACEVPTCPAAHACECKEPLTVPLCPWG